jgi:hypothetical protein
MKALKDLFILTQIELINYLPKFDEFEYINKTMNFDNVEEISDSLSFKRFIHILNFGQGFNKIENEWSSLNKKFLRTIVTQVEKDIQSNNILYFYTLPDIKLIRFEITYSSNRINLKMNYLNPEFIWLHPYTQYNRNPLIIRKYMSDF